MLKKILTFGCAFAFTLAATAQQQRPMTKEDSLLRNYQTLAKTGTAEEKKKVQNEIMRLANTKEEKDLTLAIHIANATNQSGMADSLNNVAVQRYPNGKSAFYKGYNNIISNTPNQSAKKIAAYEAWIKKFPEPKTDADIAYDYARSEIAGSFAEERNIKQNAYWINQIKNQSYKGIVQNADAKLFLSKGDTATAEALIRSGLENSKLTLANNPNPGAKRDYMSYLNSYASLLYQERKYKEALTAITEVYEGTPQKSAGLNELYALIITSNGRGKEALPTLTDLMKNGKNSPDDLKALKAAYIQDKGSEAGYTEFLSGLKDAMKENIRIRLAKEMLAQDAPAFTLVDLDGKQVSLAELKGKVVVLDFWATWCGPCKRSFPAMQMAVNKYKADPNVMFLFIDTWERIPDPSKNVKSFITDNKYTFRVLLDDKNTKVVDKFGIQGIPSKFVIGADGKIRFKLTGFDGADEAAVEELSYMIETARKAS